MRWRRRPDRLTHGGERLEVVDVMYEESVPDDDDPAMELVSYLVWVRRRRRDEGE